jgi:hypothetical protein
VGQLVLLVLQYRRLQCYIQWMRRLQKQTPLHSSSSSSSSSSSMPQDLAQQQQQQQVGQGCAMH